MEIVTNHLSKSELQRELDEAAELLFSFGFVRVNVEYGWGCNLPVDKLWTASEINTCELTQFIANSTKQGIFSLGSSDLIVTDNGRSFELRFCHESDIHLRSENTRLTKAWTDRWLAKDFSVSASTPDGSWQSVEK